MGLILIAGLLFTNVKCFSQDPNFHIYLCFGQSNMEGAAKAELQDRIEADISKGIRQFGMSDKYWAYIEELAYQYWQELNRHAIFNFSF